MNSKRYKQSQMCCSDAGVITGSCGVGSDGEGCSERDYRSFFSSGWATWRRYASCSPRWRSNVSRSTIRRSRHSCHRAHDPAAVARLGKTVTQLTRTEVTLQAATGAMVELSVRATMCSSELFNAHGLVGTVVRRACRKAAGRCGPVLPSRATLAIAASLDAAESSAPLVCLNRVQ